MKFSQKFFEEASEICSAIDTNVVEKLVEGIASVRDAGGRLFVLGVGGSAGNASHAVNDFRKLCGIEAYSPADNVSELTARANDEGWETVFSGWLDVSRLCGRDALMIFSVGGGDLEKGVSVNLVRAIDRAKAVGAAVFGVVGRREGYTAQNADVFVAVPVIDSSRLTPHAEAFQAVIWHCMVSHPLLQRSGTKW